jgi:two-component system cell cycle sensor histidine kinase/response regulator CckA
VIPAKILIVEDEVIVAEDIRRRLTQLGYEVVATSESGEQALTLVEKVRPDLILMDIRLRGEMDGIAAAERIRQQHQLPVVYLTAHADEATLERAKVTEPFGYVIKPFDERELGTVIEMGLYKHQAERQLRENERRYATTLNSIGDGVLTTDHEGRVTFMNPIAEQLTGWPLRYAKGLASTQVFRLINEESREPVENPTECVLRDGGVGLTHHALLLARNGTEIPIEDSAAPIQDDQGRCSGAVLVFRDITEKRRIERERQQLEERLQQAQKMEAIGQLAGGVAHDFNNMLTVIKGFTSMILGGIEPDHPWHSFLSEIDRAGDRAADLTRQLLAFARKQMLQPRILDLNQVLVDIVKLLHPLLGEPIELITRTDPTIPRVKTDPGQLEQILINLAVNARDAMPEGGTLTLTTQRVVHDEDTIRAEPERPRGPRARLIVSDTGCGMAPASLARIFEPFFTTKEMGRGTGLGLAAVYGIVKQSGGHIEVASEPGRGTHFTLDFPAAPEAEPSRDLAVPGPNLPGGTETLLVVEDEDVVRDLIANVLQPCGYTILKARDGAEALERSTAYPEPVDLLLTDLVMPDMDGHTLARLLRVHRPRLRVLYMSGHADPDLGELEGPQGEGCFLQKPFTPTSLATRIREVLDQK